MFTCFTILRVLSGFTCYRKYHCYLITQQPHTKQSAYSVRKNVSSTIAQQVFSNCSIRWKHQMSLVVDHAFASSLQLHDGLRKLPTNSHLNSRRKVSAEVDAP